MYIDPHTVVSSAELPQLNSVNLNRFHHCHHHHRHRHRRHHCHRHRHRQWRISKMNIKYFLRSTLAFLFHWFHFRTAVNLNRFLAVGGKMEILAEKVVSSPAGGFPWVRLRPEIGSHNPLSQANNGGGDQARQKSNYSRTSTSFKKAIKMWKICRGQWLWQNLAGVPSYSICPLTNEELNLSVSGILTRAAIGTSGTILKPKYVKLIQV